MPRSPTMKELTQITTESLSQTLAAMNGPRRRPVAVPEAQDIRRRVSALADLWLPSGDGFDARARPFSRFALVDDVHDHRIRFEFDGTWTAEATPSADPTPLREAGFAPLEEFDTGEEVKA